ncbi:MAG TPA: YbaB/EbfC family nucleoid-associated protein [Saprospiraceae bacterium]|nr:YbaB/EbfC family nucleoid-associated protein [Saprospiraceae bacterium]MCB9270366.1 YbaB/EbfC family nucleoid-associated protein [Lewinellaceae bacterium]HPG08525.1 YbaB/EbfC family nucleoid-associated protein [Saprospiraceae bacterium]HPR00793.1 YbaB/EbfC family nucleoid-associated protein [Saprospiraceae bacterium]HQU53169.1 YbaB/EbfC family nucleoid-associated protein [Saprospiraceae bacterium]
MLDQLFGNLEEQQKQMKENLRKIPVSVQSSDGAITIEMNAAREILNISIAESAVEENGVEYLEDLLVTLLNEAMAKVQVEESNAMQSQMQQLLPGLGGLSSLFK